MTRIATYNVEWFDRLFDGNGAPLADDGWSARYNVTRAMQLNALARVFRAVDADAVVVIEAPDTSRRRDGMRALERFADWAGLRTRTALIGFANDTQQEIALLYDPDLFDAAHDPLDAGDAPRFDGEFHIDLDIDDRRDTVRWSKPPLEVALRRRSGGQDMRLVGVHAKSKSPHGATDHETTLALNIANRRKQLAQCIWLRRRVAAHLAAGDALIVAGDFNDGPGLDRFEALFGRSGLDIVRGGPDEIQLIDPHAVAGAAAPTSARFWIDPEQRWLEAMLDYAMVTPGLAAAAKWRIWHPLRGVADAGLKQALLTASDHFPVSVDLDL